MTHENITKDEAYKLMCKGHRISHEYYSDDEYLYMKGSIIYTEEGYPCGNYLDKFWKEIQRWPTGWKTVS